LTPASIEEVKEASSHLLFWFVQFKSTKMDVVGNAEQLVMLTQVGMLQVARTVSELEMTRHCCTQFGAVVLPLPSVARIIEVMVLERGFVEAERETDSGGRGVVEVVLLELSEGLGGAVGSWPVMLLSEGIGGPVGGEAVRLLSEGFGGSVGSGPVMLLSDGIGGSVGIVAMGIPSEDCDVNESEIIVLLDGIGGSEMLDPEMLVVVLPGDGKGISEVVVGIPVKIPKDGLPELEELIFDKSVVVPDGMLDTVPVIEEGTTLDELAAVSEGPPVVSVFKVDSKLEGLLKVGGDGRTVELLPDGAGRPDRLAVKVGKAVGGAIAMVSESEAGPSHTVPPGKMIFGTVVLLDGPRLITVSVGIGIVSPKKDVRTVREKVWEATEVRPSGPVTVELSTVMGATGGGALEGKIEDVSDFVPEGAEPLALPGREVAVKGPPVDTVDPGPAEIDGGKFAVRDSEMEELKNTVPPEVDDAEPDRLDAMVPGTPDPDTEEAVTEGIGVSTAVDVDEASDGDPKVDGVMRVWRPVVEAEGAEVSPGIEFDGLEIEEAEAGWVVTGSEPVAEGGTAAERLEDVEDSPKLPDRLRSDVAILEAEICPGIVLPTNVVSVPTLSVVLEGTPVLDTVEVGWTKLEEVMPGEMLTEVDSVTTPEGCRDSDGIDDGGKVPKTIVELKTDPEEAVGDTVSILPDRDGQIILLWPTVLLNAGTEKVDSTRVVGVSLLVATEPFAELDAFEVVQVSVVVSEATGASDW
jgi:hypothetical protein